MNAPLPRAVTFGSVCSGIEAASVAWNPLGWSAGWLAEIERFPCALLAHHYPGVPNLGDMRKIPAMLRNGIIYPPDVFTGGTPCQAFSLAGLRESLDDARGNLSLTFCEIANEIDIQRAANGLLPAVVVWENVPGVLSTKDNAFGHFLAGLAGEDDPLVPAGKKWADAGCVYGPQRAVAWRVLDAQFFGLAQRRRRVFVVSSARDGFDPARVLFEFEGVRRDFAPRRETGQDTAGGTLRSTDGGCDLDHAQAGHLQPVAFGGNNQSGPIDVATARNACASASGRMDFESETFVVQARSVALRGREGGGTAELGDDLANCLRASTGGGDKPHVLATVAHAFDARQSDVIQYGDFTGPFDTCGSSIGVMVPQPETYAIQAGALRENPASGPDGIGVQAHIAYTLEARAEVQAVAFSCKDYGADATTELAPTMRAMGHSGSQANAGRQPIVAAFQERGRPDGSKVDYSPELSYALLAPNGGSRSQERNVQVGMAVRRLTPRECERLQGFPDDYTLIPYGRAVRMEKLEQDWIKYLLRGGVMTLDQVCRAAADGPRYKALGNSWAVPVVRWIGSRIDAELQRLDADGARNAGGCALRSVTRTDKRHKPH